MTPPAALAYFITPHGFGHAARACAVMNALHRQRPDLVFHLFTGVPEWFFSDSLDGPFQYHPLASDIGLVQRTPTAEDLPATIARLAAYWPLSEEKTAPLAAQLQALGCRLVLCDIAPLGIAAAQQAGLPSILIENFTWDWIYTGYLELEPRFATFIPQIQAACAAAAVHLQTRPACLPDARFTSLNPVFRSPRQARAETRQRLGIPLEAKAVLVTMGGIPPAFSTLDHLSAASPAWFILPGAGERFERRGRLVLMPHHSEFYHPDLVFAADAVVGKAGYSTLAEAYAAGIPFGHVARPRFREAAVMADFIQNEMGGIELAPDEFESGAWAARVDKLLALPRRQRDEIPGAEQAAAVVLGLIGQA